ncbi:MULTISPECIES: NPCBM/NEW2 domain-containing protein [unclassified Streptomyces]|uniref:NPCBM/NEW2 domain-containing protein n=1 Tax=unclassified Streptomyces TaxID=2593676 RepID=UPI001DDE7A50|nr:MULTISPECIES: NPCBM/NEW2 domain-containing protein [unclassified Streptomyces]MBD0709264.1 hypothetical protein [Streptomyces sp. CBMA291]MBD0717636.1 hypothetical protein [Streptomyces sp. CBMA370]
MPDPEPEPKPDPPRVYQINELSYGFFDGGEEPKVVFGESSWMWQRDNLFIDGTRYAHGVSVQAPSSLVIALNRQCTGYDAVVGIDDLSPPLGVGGVRFSVYGDDKRLWRSAVVRPGDSPLPVHLGISGHARVRLVVENHTPFGRAAVADWADSRLTCS